MATPTVSTHGAMEGCGSYNLHAKVPAGGGNLARGSVESLQFSVLCRCPSGIICFQKREGSCPQSPLVRR